MFRRTIDILGLLGGTMALTSLIYGTFEQPLFPYMQGILGGVIEAYQAMRDYLFGGLGWTFSALINIARKWITGWPTPPWFILSKFQTDLIVLVSVTISASWQGLAMASLRRHTSVVGDPNTHFFKQRRVEIDEQANQIDQKLSRANLLRKRIVGTTVPIVTERRYANGNVYVKINERAILSLWPWVSIIVFAQYAISAMLFFGLVYAENQIGL